MTAKRVCNITSDWLLFIIFSLKILLEDNIH